MKQGLIDRLKNSEKPLILNGAGVVGEAVLDFCQAHGFPVAAVCDGSVKVTGSDFHGYRVIHTSRLKEHFADALVLISAAAIKDVVDLLQAQGLNDWIAAGPLLEDEDTQQDAPEVDARKFSIETCIDCHRGYLEPDKVFLRSVDIIITERCSLKCRDCSNLAQYYQRPKNVPLQLIDRSIDALCAVVDEIMELRVIGGDAFMNKDWPKVVARLIGESKAKRIVIYTNGTIVPKDEYAPLLSHPKVLTVVTDYGALSRNLPSLRSYFDRHQIAHRILTVDSWLDCATIDKHERTEEGNQRLYQECCAKNMLSLSDGKLFRCPFAANADRLAAVPDLPDDYVDILAGDEDELRHRIKSYVLRNTPLSICDYCSGRPLSGSEVMPAVQTTKPLPYFSYDRPGGKHE